MSKIESVQYFWPDSVYIHKAECKFLGKATRSPQTVLFLNAKTDNLMYILF